MSVGGDPHLLLGRIRFLNRCIECLRRSEPLPESLCFVPKEVCYKICRDSSCSSVSSSSSASTSAAGTGGIVLIPAWESPHQAPNKKSCKFTIEPKKGSCIRTSGEEYYNSHGLWVKITKEQMEQYCSGVDLEEGWILACKHTEGGTRLVPVERLDSVTRQQQIFGFDHKLCNRWEEVVDAENCLHLGARPKITERDEAAVQKLRYIPPTWTFECDEDLVRYFYDQEDQNLGTVKQYVNKIDVSSCSTDVSGGATCLTDGDTETFWESDGMSGQHWIRLHMKKGTVVSKLLVSVDSTDDTYTPKLISVYGGEGDNLQKYGDVTIEDDLTGEVCVLEDMSRHLPIIEIRIEECRDGGLNVKIRGLKIISSCDKALGLNADMFKSSNLVRYPRLEGTPPDVLYRRMLVILRFITILDRLLPHLVPTWNYSLGTFNQIKDIKQFLLLSLRRSALITQCLKDSESSKPSGLPSIYIHRRLAMEHRENPSLDPKCKHAVFTQVYERLKPSDKYEKPLDYRWPASHDQWWECKFIEEGIIDNGGGFRDSLSDMSEELCPSSAKCLVPLPFFIRTSNQEGAGEMRDFYVPNPSCRDFQKFEWIGQLMGAAFRGKEYLVLALPGLVWKQLIGETVSWNKDFPAVDSMLVKLLDSMVHMDKATFEFKFGQELVYSTPLSDGRLVELIPGGSSVVVRYEDRVEFTHLVQKARLEESREQLAAIQAGLMKVVPQAVLDLLTWQEVEKKVCGDPEINLEALKHLTRYEDLDQNDVRVQHMWEALTNFTNEDRSRFLRFVTGRSRLPAPICIYPDKQGSDITDALPQSSTCSSTLYLPKYPSAKVCEEKLRYAAYNCVAIDTDMNPWEE
ncbi:E3 ubiquitin-protein ligase HECTD3-like [Clarias gariepinus]|uniref:E3 ubiquitin-protein ligase HECTD3-like n=1 Tax=Clarias gariepinus TaxID=13013 RepID=UPI00234C5BF3|nr:E3 ubiquitin-protein ligase HECTD3-like [Clarias gariepinus]